MLNLQKKLWFHLSRRRHKQFGLLLILMILSSITEVVSIGAVLPFLATLTSPEEIYQYPSIQPFIDLFQVNSAEQLLFPLTVVFILAVFISGGVRMALLYTTTRLSNATGSDLSVDIYQRTLYQPYATHIARNSSEIITGIISKTGSVVGGAISPILTLISATFIISSILTALIFIDSTVALLSATGFAVIYGGVVHYSKQKLQENGQCIADKSTDMIKALQEGLGGIRDLIIDNTQEFYCKIYRNADLPLRRALADNTIISESPRYIMEMIGIILIATIAYLMSLRDDGLTTSIPVLGALALGAQRMLPALQQVYQSYTTIKGSQAIMRDVVTLLDQHMPHSINQQLVTSLMPFEKEIRLNNLSFRYTEKTPWVLKNINLTLKKGARIGFVGTTGSGKSTMLDIVMGLLSPNQGDVLIDNQAVTEKNIRSWQMHISHVPQNIYLADTTIEQNIAFGVPKEEINLTKVKQAAQQSQISKLVESWPEQYNTIVGERGVRLSGGQRQRIGIARALYKQSNVLVFDEATSALDNRTERELMNAIDGLNRELTILIIAHRTSTLKNCDQIVSFDDDGKITICKYKDLIE